MKKRPHYITWLLSLVFAVSACGESEPFLFDEDYNGAYFDYNLEADFKRTLNFSDYIVGNPDTVTITLDVKLLGYLQEQSRTLAVKTKDIEGYEPADVTIEDVVFSNKEYKKQIEVKVKRPAVEDITYAVCIYLDGSGDIGAGIEGKNEIRLFVKESYEKPALWYSHIETFLGRWSKEKYKFLANHTGNNNFISTLYDEKSASHDYDAALALNVSAVSALLAQEPDEPIVVDLPILLEKDYPAYTVPYFWGLYEQHLGAFRASKFCRVATMLGGATTSSVAALFATEDAGDKMEAEAENFHKDDVIWMLNEYYRNALSGTPIANYKETLFWVPIRTNGNYTVRIPYWWEDPDALGTLKIVERYFGKYSADKYQYMLKTMIKVEGSDTFIAASLFPFVYDAAGGTWCWDSSPLGKNGLSGEERLKECYRIIKADNDGRPENRRYDIPDVTIE